LESLNLQNDLVFKNKIVVNDTTDGDSFSGSIKASGGISVTKGVYANSISLPGSTITGGSLLNISNSLINLNSFTKLGDNISIKMKK